MPTNRIAHDTRSDRGPHNVAHAETETAPMEAAETRDPDSPEAVRFARLRPNGPGGTFVLWDGVVVPW